VRLLLILLIVLGVLAVLAVRAKAAGRNPSRRASEQHQTVQPDDSPAGTDRPATRDDGRPIPGSADDRHQHGKP
jgi:hypothetical protein